MDELELLHLLRHLTEQAMIRLLLLALLFAPCAQASDWSLLVVHRDGAVIESHHMTRQGCQFARARVLGEPASKAERAEQEAQRGKSLEQRTVLDEIAARRCEFEGYKDQYFELGQDRDGWVHGYFCFRDEHKITPQIYKPAPQVYYPSEVTHAECYQ